MKCILCESKSPKIIENINTNNLIKLYRYRYKINVSSYFEGYENINLLKCDDCGLFFYQPHTPGDEKFYEKLQKSSNYYIKEKDEYFIASKFIEPGQKVLDIGSGIGEFANYLDTKVQYTGLEFNQKAIIEGKKRGFNILNEDLFSHQLKFKDYYDAVCYFQVLEHISQPKEFIKNSINALKPDGILIIAVPSNNSFIGKSVNNYLNAPPHHATLWSDETLGRISEIFDLDLISISHDNVRKDLKSYYHRVIIFNKVRKFFRLEQKRFDITPLSSMAFLIAYILSIFFGVFSQKKIEAFGHSVIAIYRKRK